MAVAKVVVRVEARVGAMAAAMRAVVTVEAKAAAVRAVAREVGMAQGGVATEEVWAVVTEVVAMAEARAVEKEAVDWVAAALVA